MCSQSENAFGVRLRLDAPLRPDRLAREDLSLLRNTSCRAATGDLDRTPGNAAGALRPHEPASRNSSVRKLSGAANEGTAGEDSRPA
jgi:hypothetical protein